MSDLGWHLSLITNDAHEASHLFQCVSVLIQQYNAVAFQGSFIEDDDDVISRNCFNSVFNPGDLYY